MMDLQRLRGKSVSRIRRIYFVVNGWVDTRAGALELRFQDGSFLLLDTRSDWTPDVKQEEWSAFTPLRSDENANDLDDNGQFMAFDISDMMSACLCIGRRLNGYREMIPDMSGVSECIGIILEFNELTVKAVSDAGEIRVEWEGPDFSLCDLPTTLVLK